MALVSQERDLAAARRFFTRALSTTTPTPVEVITDQAAVYPRVLQELAPGAWHHTEPYANNRIEADHGQIKRRLRPMRGVKTERGARIITAGHGYMQNIRRGHDELGGQRTSEPAGDGRLRRAGPDDLTNPEVNDLAYPGFA